MNPSKTKTLPNVQAETVGTPHIPAHVSERSRERARVGLVGAVGTSQVVDLAQDLRRRLRGIAALLAGLVGAALLLRLLFNYQSFLGSSPDSAARWNTALAHLGVVLIEL
jgi:hypothetical protein